MEMKQLYILSGGTDGYVSASFTFDGDLAEKVLARDVESYPDRGCLDSITVPAWMTYKDLGIFDPIEDNFEDEDDE